MTLRRILAATSVLVLTVVIACESERGPLAPSSQSVGATGGTATLMPEITDPGLPQEDVTLKATQPGLASPPDGAIVNDPAAVLSVSNPQGRFAVAVFLVRFEVWALSGSPLPVQAHSAVVPQGVGSTSYTLPDGELQDSTLYAWRARAERDGAVGPWSEVYGFTTLFVRIDPPVPLVPIGGLVISTLRPRFTVANGAVIGDAGVVLIEVQVTDADDPNFDRVIEVARTRMRDRGETNIPVQKSLELDTLYYWRARGTSEDLPITAVLPYVPTPSQSPIQTAVEVTSDWSATETFRTSATAGGGGGSPGSSVGAPFTTPGGEPPVLLSVVQQVAAQNPGALANSCQEEGGTWQFMDILIETLRSIDGRWGYNCKRGNCADLSLDVIDYYRGSGTPDESTDVSIIDVIGGHCGPNPTPSWSDVTKATKAAGGVGRWKYPR